MSTFLGQLFWVLFWANQLQEILFLILWKNNFFWSKLFEQLFWVILLLKVLFWVNILFKVIFWGLFWVGLLFWGLFWVTFLLQTLFWVNLLKKLLKKVLKKVLKERSPQKSTQKSPFILLFWIQNLYLFLTGPSKIFLSARGFSYYTPWGPPPSPPSKSDKTLYTGIYLPTFREGTHFIIKVVVLCLGALTGLRESLPPLHPQIE